MALVPISGPSIEPVSIDEAKAHLRVTNDAEDLLIASLVTAARVHIELSLGSAFITQTWSWFLDAWPQSRGITLPLGPLRTINAIRVLTAGDVVETIDPADYVVSAAAQPPQLTLKKRSVWSRAVPQPAYATNGIEIDFTAGFGDAPSSVPQPLRQSILLLTAHWYEQRSPIEVGQPSTELPSMVAELTRPYRQVRL